MSGQQFAIAVMVLGAMLVLTGLLRLGRASRTRDIEGEPMAPLEIAVEFTPAPIRADRRVQEGQRYRRAADPLHAMRFRWNRPPGLSRRLARWVPVTGISRGDRPMHAAGFIAGRDQRLELERVPETVPGHPNAIRVWGRWTDSDGRDRREELGWVPAGVAGRIAGDASAIDLVAQPRALFMPVAGRSSGVRMDIWTNARRRRQGPAGA